MSDVAAVLALDAARFDAQVAGDKARLEELLADELHYTHSNALVDTKASYIDSIISGRVRYRQIDCSGQHATVFGDAAICTGSATLHVTAGGHDRNLNLRYTDVWVRRSGTWQMVAWQSTLLP
ncbi:MAG: nuclear transport factor 2 family protein [Acidimicrobiales bacterium]